MNPIKIVILVLSPLVIVCFVLNFVFEKGCFNCYPTIFSYVAQLFMYIGSIILIVAASCELSNNAYRNALALLYIGDIFSLGSIFAFAFWPIRIGSYYYSAGIFNWAALVSVLIITPLIVLVHVYLCKNSSKNIAIPSKDTPLQPTYQQY